MSAKGRPETVGLEEAGPNCGTNLEYDHGCRCASCTTAHSMVCLRAAGKRAERAGRPLTRRQAALRAEDLADADDRLFYRWHGPAEGGWLEEIIRLPPAKDILAWRARRQPNP